MECRSYHVKVKILTRPGWARRSIGSSYWRSIRKTGNVLWDKMLRDAIPARHTYASNSGLTDGEHLYAYFGSMGLYCLEGSVELIRRLACN